MNKESSLLIIFWNKTLRQKLFLFRIFLMLNLIGVANLLLPFKVYSRFLGQINSESTQNPKNVDWTYVEQVSKSVKNVSKVSPIEFKCLVQATVGKYFVARERIDSTIYFGVKKDESHHLKAHAWLRVGSKIVLGGEVADQYNIVSTYS
ncbi:MAG: lasso peptide biosynthesis B2 protein [Bacteroidetes bacterium]|jgi:hypothetical protein|nr:lasso peptide biosynthesis B2 protein [Bacteroidota bacterium]